ncbi:hypothetical protein IAQ61_003364 [Plenodomus lingam]|uniref:uncharacterized protein n=1 Tax=Leptosphaeria maculans TaxID=5022 RepID=UPI003323B195|nr:hypothetical protein IAQ61_003364 [Plenodomus lingam]
MRRRTPAPKRRLTRPQHGTRGRRQGIQTQFTNGIEIALGLLLAQIQHQTELIRLEGVAQTNHQLLLVCAAGDIVVGPAVANVVEGVGFSGGGDAGADVADVDAEDGRDAGFGAQAAEGGGTKRGGHLCVAGDGGFGESLGGACVLEPCALKGSVFELGEAEDDVEGLVGFELVEDPGAGFGVVADGFKGLRGVLAGSLDHLFGADGEEVGLAVDFAQVEFGAVVGHEAALGVGGEEVLVAELDVVVIEVVDFGVGFVGVEGVAFGVEGVCEELSNDQDIGGERLGEEAVDHGHRLDRCGWSRLLVWGVV